MAKSVTATVNSQKKAGLYGKTGPLFRNCRWWFTQQLSRTKSYETALLTLIALPLSFVG